MPDKGTCDRATKAARAGSRGTGDFSLHSSRLGGAVSRAKAGDKMPSIMKRVFWKSAKTARRCTYRMQLGLILFPGCRKRSLERLISTL